MKKIKIPLSRLFANLRNNALVLEQEPDETYTSSMFLVIPDQEIEVEIDEDRGEHIEADTRRQLAIAVAKEERWNDHIPGNSCPVAPSTKVFIRLRNGSTSPKPVKADSVHWDAVGVSRSAQIVAWKRA